MPDQVREKCNSVSDREREKRGEKMYFGDELKYIFRAGDKARVL